MPEDDDPSNRSQVDVPGPVPTQCVWPEMCAADPASQRSLRENRLLHHLLAATSTFIVFVLLKALRALQ
jgi:hypothetical protein